METYDVFTVTLNPAIDRTLTISEFRTGSVNRVESESVKPGGKGINVAIALQQQGFTVAATGFLGDANPAIFEKLCKEQKIAHRFVSIPGETRVGIKIVDPVGGNTTDINFPGLKPTPAEISSLLGSISNLTGKWCVLGGSLPPGIPPHFYRDLTTSLKARGIRVALDTSGEALIGALEAKPDLIKPNIHELEELVGNKLPTQESVRMAARSLVRDGVGLVVVSMGERGALFVSENETLTAFPPQIEVGSTVGAGDAMVAGTVAGLLQELTLANSARLATAFSLSVLLHGHVGSVSSLDKLKQQVSIL